jgi:hypothetical protein
MTWVSPKRLSIALPWVVLLILVGLGANAGILLCHLPDTDTLPDIENAIELVRHGYIPEKGNISSYGAYNPPGPSWLFAPGVLIFENPGLFPVPGLIGVYAGTAVGVFLLARTFFGTGCALLATGLYGLSSTGLTVASYLWQRYPMQLFVVWTVLWLCQWVARKDSKYLALALVTWAAGAYVFLEIAPLLCIIPVLWFIFRPPIRIRPLAVGGRFVSLSGFHI